MVLSFFVHIEVLHKSLSSYIGLDRVSLFNKIFGDATIVQWYMCMFPPRFVLNLLSFLVSHFFPTSWLLRAGADNYKMTPRGDIITSIWSFTLLLLGCIGFLATFLFMLNVFEQRKESIK